MKITSGKYEVLESGIIHSYEMNDIEFIVNEKLGMKLILEVVKEEKNESTVNVRAKNEKELVITYTNPHVQLNYGSSTPMAVGSIDKRELYVTIRVNVIGDYISYQAAYTFFLGEAAA